jgi:hypothetical protein
MTLAIPIEGWLDLVALLLQIFPIYVQIRHYFHSHYRVSLFLTLMYISMGGIFGFGALGEFLLSSACFTICALFLIPLSISSNLVIDALAREKVEPIRLAALTFLAGLFIWTSTLPGAVVLMQNNLGEMVLGWNGWFKNLGAILSLFAAIAFAYPIFRMYWRVRHSTVLGPPGRWLTSAALCYWVAGIMVAIPAAGFQIFMAIAALITARIYSQHSKLYFILSMRALRLSVIQSETGLLLFSYTWRSGTNMAEEQLFSGMIQGVGLIVREAMNRGNLKEIRLANGVILLKSSKDMPIICALAATRSSQTLENALSLFYDRFTTEYAQALNQPEKVSQFDRASKLVEECFPFIPEYDM